MRPRPTRRIALAALLALLLVATACSGDDGDRGAAATDERPPVDGPVQRSGTLPSGSAWALQVPDGWNGTLLLYSHGLVPPGARNPLLTAPDAPTAAALFGEGYALLASAYPDTGWVVTDAVHDQLAVLDRFRQEVGEPLRTVAWGSSMGSLVTAAMVEQHPDRFDGALAECSVLGGAVALWDQFLGVSFALHALLGPDPETQLAGITADQAAVERRLEERITAAAGTSIGAARLALVAAVNGMPGSSDGKDDVARQAKDLIATARAGAAARADLERRVGGNPSTNVGVDYAALLEAAPRRSEVAADYVTAGGDLDGDLAALASAPRVRADPAARRRLARAYDPTGDLRVPMLLLHTTGDPAAIQGNLVRYRQLVEEAGDDDLLRTVQVARHGHCAFLPHERVAAIDALVERVRSGDWPELEPGALRRRASATAAGRSSNERAAFTDVEPQAYPLLDR